MICLVVVASFRVPVCLGVMSRGELEEYGIDDFLTFVEMCDRRTSWWALANTQRSGLTTTGHFEGPAPR